MMETMLPSSPPPEEGNVANHNILNEGTANPEDAEHNSTPEEYPPPILASDSVEDVLKASEELLGRLRLTPVVTPTASAEAPVEPAAPAVNNPPSRADPPLLSTMVYVQKEPNSVSTVGSGSILPNPNLFWSANPQTESNMIDETTSVKEENDKAPGGGTTTEPNSPQVHSPPPPPPPTASQLDRLAGGLVIPDFTKSAANQTWEKVNSAAEGDDDFVPLVDYSKERKANSSTTKQKSFATFHGEEETLDPMARSRQALKSRVKAEKRRRKRLLVGTVLLVGALSLGVFVFWPHHDSLSLRPEQEQTSNSESEDTTHDIDDTPADISDVLEEVGTQCFDGAAATTSCAVDEETSSAGTSGEETATQESSKESSGERDAPVDFPKGCQSKISRMFRKKCRTPTGNRDDHSS